MSGIDGYEYDYDLNIIMFWHIATKSTLVGFTHSVYTLQSFCRN